MSQFTIALSGLTEKDIASVQSALDAPGSDWSLVDGVEGDLLMVDIDSVWGHMDWLRATANGVRTIAYTDQAEVRNCDLMLHKPIDVGALKDLLAQLSSSSVDGRLAFDIDATEPEPEQEPAPDIEAEIGATVSAIEAPASGHDAVPEPPVEAPAAASPEANVSLVARARAAAALTPGSHAPAPASQPPAPSNRAEPPGAAQAAAAAAANPSSAATQSIGHALLAGKITRPIRVESHGVVLQIDPERGGYHAPAMLKPLQPLLELPVGAAQALDAQALEQLHLSPALPLTRLLWFAALCYTPGELTAPLGRQSVYHLTRWPQIEREFPRHFRIATAMMKQPDTVDSIAEAAKAPVEDVIDFINAYFMAGFVNTDTGASDSGMLSRLRRPFGR